MTQTTDGISGAGFRKVEFSTNFSSWTDASGFVATVEPSGGALQYGSLNTANQRAPIVTTGDLDPETVTVTGVYTEGAAELVRVAYAAKAAGTAFYLRWSKSGTIGERRYSTDQNNSYVVEALEPGRPGGPDPLTVNIVIATAKVDHATIS